MTAKDKEVLRGLAQRYAELSTLDVQQERLDRYKRTTNLEIVRPVVLIFEVPWGEIGDTSLVNVCSPEYRWIEGHLRKALYQWDHFQVDQVIEPVFKVGKRTRSTGIGLKAHDTSLATDSGSHICAHEYDAG